MFRRQQQNRNAPRVPSYGRAQILDIEGRPVQQCVVKEISRSGANIVANDPKSLPRDCEIWIPHLNLSVKAHVRWRKKDRAGLQFDKPLSDLQLGATGQGWKTAI